MVRLRFSMYSSFLKTIANKFIVKTGIFDFSCLSFLFLRQCFWAFFRIKPPVLDGNVVSLIPFSEGLTPESFFDDEKSAHDIYHHSLTRFQSRELAASKPFTIFLNLAGSSTKTSAIYSPQDRLNFYLHLFSEVEAIVHQPRYSLLEPDPEVHEYLIKSFMAFDNTSSVTNLVSRVTLLNTRRLDSLMYLIDDCHYFIGREGADTLLAVFTGIPCTIYKPKGSPRFSRIEKAMHQYQQRQTPNSNYHHQYFDVTSQDSTKTITLRNHSSTIPDILSHMLHFSLES